MPRLLSDSPPANSGSPAELWWLVQENKAVGPYERSEIQRGLRAGAVLPSDLACPESGAQWRALHDWPAFSNQSDQSSAFVPGIAAVPTRPSWNPANIAQLGLLFSPLWAGVMATMNSKRLGGGLPVWRPILIAVVGFISTSVLENSVARGFWWTWAVDLLMYLATLWAIWQWGLRCQFAAYMRQPQRADAKWLWPAILGAPLGVYVVLALVAAPFAPLEPREVAQRFLNTNDLPTIEHYSTPRLWPAMQASWTGVDDGSHANVTYDRDGDANTNTHWTGFVLYTIDGTGSHAIDGTLRLVDFDGSWKVDEMYFTAYDSQTFPQPVAISVDYPKLLAAATPQPVTATPASPAQVTPDPAVPVATPAATDVPGAQAGSTPTVAQVMSQPQMNSLLSSATTSVVNHALASGGNAAERQVAAAVAHEAEQAAGHDAGSLLARGGKAAGAAILGVIVLLFKLLQNLLESAKPIAKLQEPAAQLREAPTGSPAKQSQ